MFSTCSSTRRMGWFCSWLCCISCISIMTTNAWIQQLQLQQSSYIRQSSISTTSLLLTRNNDHHNLFSLISPNSQLLSSQQKQDPTDLPITPLQQLQHQQINNRRSFVTSSIGIITASTMMQQQQTSSFVANAAVQQAVGSGESKCRANNNCLEIGELDGAIGWGWGGKDRCDPSNPICGTDGKMLVIDKETNQIIGKPVPKLPSDTTIISHVVSIDIGIGRDEIGTLKIGLYGNDCPQSVEQFIKFVSDNGLTTFVTGINDKVYQNTINAYTVPVSLQQGGTITEIVPTTVIQFGIPVQSIAYGKSRGIGKSKLDGFVPQPKPISLLQNTNKDTSTETTTTTTDIYVRNHDSPGLISIPSSGIGYGGTGFESDDEVYDSAFFITASNDVKIISTLVSTYDTTNTKLQQQRQRRVIGQILDPQSMAFLERLANIPTKRGIRGVIPGQTSGPPLIKTYIKDIQIAKVVVR